MLSTLYAPRPHCLLSCRASRHSWSMTRRVSIVLLVGAAIASAWYVWPGRSRAELPLPDAAVHDLAGRLATHVGVLAGQIGTRHVQRPAALESAARYIEQRFVENHYHV